MSARARSAPPTGPCRCRLVARGPHRERGSWPARRRPGPEGTQEDVTVVRVVSVWVGVRGLGAAPPPEDDEGNR